MHLPAADHKRLNDVTPEQCKKACEEEVTFHCMSFDYNYANRFCLMSLNSRYDSKISTEVNYEYYERVCYGKSLVICCSILKYTHYVSKFECSLPVDQISDYFFLPP